MTTPPTQPTLPSLRGSTASKEKADPVAVQDLIDEICALYVEDDTPWIVGYSGGKDSTACVQLVWSALLSLDPCRRTKPVHVISTDTRVENPVIAQWASVSLDRMDSAAKEQGLPIVVHSLTPRVEESFWVRLIGHGYAAPRQKYRWCTSRLKISPSNTFILNLTQEEGGSILVLGTRKAESAGRRTRMERLEAVRTRARLSPNAALPGALVYSPIEDWTTDDVWIYLLQNLNPWGHSNKGLLTIYSGASEGGECPLVVDKGTPSCGKSRFGCWVCTLVEGDKSLSAMVSNDHHKEWLLPLLNFRARHLEVRDEAGFWADRHLRDFRRTNGPPDLYVRTVTTVRTDERKGTTKTSKTTGLDYIPGPYLESVRHEMLRDLLAVQRDVQQMVASAEYGDLEWMQGWETISLEELEEIRRVWVMERGEVEDVVPDIYEETLGDTYPMHRDIYDIPDHIQQTLSTLKALAQGDDAALLRFEMVRAMIAADWFRGLGREEAAVKLLGRTIKRQAPFGRAQSLKDARQYHEIKAALNPAPAVQSSLFGEEEALCDAWDGWWGRDLTSRSVVKALKQLKEVA